MILHGLKPERVWEYFEEISAIPHGSGNMKQITDYCKSFAKRHQLEVLQDEIGNVLIRKPATPGYENEPGVIIQGHLDMVCVGCKEIHKDFIKEGINVCTDGTLVWADNTSLGADDGIAISYMFALLEAEDIEHPALEALFTVEEEIGLVGASAFDSQLLKGTRLINIDSEEEGFITVSCAGGTRVLAELPVEYEKSSGTAYEITIKGLLGGHSGMEINKGRVNAIQLMGRLLNQLSKKSKIRICNVAGGTKENAIPSDAKAVLAVGDVSILLADFVAIRGVILKELKKTEPSLEINIEETVLPDCMMTKESTRKTVYCLYHVITGMQKMSSDFEGLVQSSLNVGICYMEDSSVFLKYSIRSSVASEKEELKDKVKDYHTFLGGSATFMAEYPAWEYRKESPLRDIVCQCYEKLYGEKAQVVAIHAGLECGIFAGNNPKLDCVSIGPNLKNVHSPQETVEVASVSRTWELLLEILKYKNS